MDPHSTLDTVRLLLDAGADSNAQNVEGDSALLIAASWGNTTYMRELIAHGADVNAQTNSGYTALMETAQHCDVEAAKLLLQCGADPTMRDERDRSILDYMNPNITAYNQKACAELRKLFRELLDHAAGERNERRG
jgi:ankyrin repeat protein